jgi:capsid protein
MFGLVLYRDALDSPAPITEEQAATDNEPAGKYKIDFGRGPVLLDLDPGDRAEFLENKTPPVEFQQFTAIIISAALKALDIPFSFYDEAYTNFFGSRAALILYLKSARAKQEDLRDLLDSLTKWRLVIALTNRELELPPGIGPDDLQIDWIPDGTPWWNPQQEISADLQAIGGTLRTRAEIRRERFGDDWYDVLAELKREEEAIKEADLTWMDSPAALITQPIPEDPPPKNGNK